MMTGSLSLKESEHQNLPTPLIIRGCRRSRSKYEEHEGGCWFSDDVLAEILCRLPRKKLVKFKCVSKSWCRLITETCIPSISLSPAARYGDVAGIYFTVYIERQLDPSWPQVVTRSKDDGLFNRHLGDLLLQEKWQYRYRGYYSDCTDDDDIDGGQRLMVEWNQCFDNKYRLPFRPNPLDLLDCCNGLLLFYNFGSSLYYVSNPATRQCVPIESTPPPVCEVIFYSYYAALAFDPRKSAGYRVVRFANYRHGRDLFLDIYSSETRVWVRHPVTLSPPLQDKLCTKCSTYFEGALYRLSSSWHLVRFDLTDTCCSARAIELPMTSVTCKGVMGCTGVLMGSLCYANEDSSSSNLLVWSLQAGSSDQNEEWRLNHKIQVNFLATSLGMSIISDDSASWIAPCAFHPGSGIIYLSTRHSILSYDLSTGELKEVTRINQDPIVPACFYPNFAYVPFLVPFDKLGNIRIVRPPLLVT